jgi:hypothetical protein
MTIVVCRPRAEYNSLIRKQAARWYKRGLFARLAKSRRRKIYDSGAYEAGKAFNIAHDIGRYDVPKDVQKKINFIRKNGGNATYIGRKKVTMPKLKFMEEGDS